MIAMLDQPCRSPPAHARSNRGRLVTPAPTEVHTRFSVPAHPRPATTAPTPPQATPHPRPAPRPPRRHHADPHPRCPIHIRIASDAYIGTVSGGNAQGTEAHQTTAGHIGHYLPWRQAPATASHALAHRRATRLTPCRTSPSRSSPSHATSTSASARMSYPPRTPAHGPLLERMTSHTAAEARATRIKNTPGPPCASPSTPWRSGACARRACSRSRDLVGVSPTPYATGKSAGHPHQMRVVQQLIGVLMQPPPPHPKPTRVMPQREVGVQQDAIHAVIAARQQIPVTFGELINHRGTLRIATTPRSHQRPPLPH
jgi:hypothetical protein